jgi:7-cyano-7-deazaguanine reductase
VLRTRPKRTIYLAEAGAPARPKLRAHWRPAQHTEARQAGRYQIFRHLSSMPTNKQDLKTLSLLGKKGAPSRNLEVFPNHAPGKISVTLHCKEFTCLCPMTGQPDYAQIEIVYTPDRYVVESKSMKLYLESYRSEGVFHEHLAVDIASDFVKFVKPRTLDVTVHFNVRGGIAISATYHYDKSRTIK